MKFNFHTEYVRFARIRKFLLVMKLTTIILLTVFLQVSNASVGVAQLISFKGTNVPIENVFEIIQTQTQYKVLYAEEMVSNAGTITVNFKNASVEQVL